jgi:hypothetical protein
VAGEISGLDGHLRGFLSAGRDFPVVAVPVEPTVARSNGVPASAGNGSRISRTG